MAITFMMYTGGAVIISSQSFYYWYEQLPSMRALKQWIERNLTSPDAIDGFEFHISWDALESYEESGSILPCEKMDFLGSTFTQSLLGLSHSTVHLPHMKQRPLMRVEEVVQMMSVIFDRTGITDFTVHPDKVPSEYWKTLQSKLPSGVSLSIENMDRRAVGYQELDEIESLLLSHEDILWTFDVCHWIELGRDLEDSSTIAFFEKYGNRLSKIHFSAPNTTRQFYSRDGLIRTSHNLYSVSNDDFLETLQHLVPSHSTWVLEGVIPLQEEPLLDEELAIMRSVQEEKPLVVSL